MSPWDPCACYYVAPHLTLTGRVFCWLVTSVVIGGGFVVFVLPLSAVANLPAVHRRHF